MSLGLQRVKSTVYNRFIKHIKLIYNKGKWKLKMSRRWINRILSNMRQFTNRVIMNPGPLCARKFTYRKSAPYKFPGFLQYFAGHTAFHLHFIVIFRTPVKQNHFTRIT